MRSIKLVTLVLLFIMVTMSADAATITVVSPNGGENWKLGTAHDIKWTSIGSPGANVKVELLKGGVLNKVISYSTPNDGSYWWAIPSNIILGTNYKIRITSTTSSAYKDASNNNFAISSPINVISPNGWENWIRGTTKTIKWSFTSNSGTNVKIELLKNGTLNRVISYSTPNDGSYNWYILSNQALGSDYKIRITSTTNSVYKDTSNNNFRISPPSITVVSPNGGEIWNVYEPSTLHNIKWNYAGNPGSSVKIELVAWEGYVRYLITPSTSNDGLYVWDVPWGIEGDFKIRITSTSNSAYTDMSNGYFMILPYYDA